MSDLLTTLHPINDNTTDLYPNVKRDNLPQNVKAELDAIPNKVDKVQGKGLSTNDFTNADKALVDTIPNKVDKVAGKGLSTNDYTNADKALVDTIPDKVNKEQGKGLSTNDFTNEYKKDLDQDIPEQIQLFKEAFEETGVALNGKVDKVSGKGLSTNDFTNADKALVNTIPDKVDKVQGKGLSTNDYTNADKSYLDNLPNYFISLAKGGVVNVADADMPTNSNTPYFGAKHGNTSLFTLAEGASSIKVTSPQFSTWASIAVNGAGGVNLVSNRDGVSSAILSAGNFKVIADHLDNGNHYKWSFEVNADNGISFTHNTPTSGNESAKTFTYKLPELDAFNSDKPVTLLAIRKLNARILAKDEVCYSNDLDVYLIMNKYIWIDGDYLLTGHQTSPENPIFVIGLGEILPIEDISGWLDGYDSGTGERYLIDVEWDPEYSDETAVEVTCGKPIETLVFKGLIKMEMQP